MLPVSVIIPCYCSSITVERAVNSVIFQTQLPKEVILVDDCSKDENKTLNKLYEIKDKFGSIMDIIVLSLKSNQGAASARNAGWSVATQQYIAFLDSDDVWHKNKLEVQYKWMKEHHQVILSGHLYEQVDDLIAFNNIEKQFGKFILLNKYKLLLKNQIATRTVMLKKNNKYKFKEGKRYSEDYLLWLQTAFLGETALLETSLAGTFKEDYGESGLSSHLWEMEKGELDTYFSLYKEDKINIFLLSLISVFSMFKFIFRVLKIKF